MAAKARPDTLTLDGLGTLIVYDDLVRRQWTEDLSAIRLESFLPETCNASTTLGVVNTGFANLGVNAMDLRVSDDLGQEYGRRWRGLLW